MFVDLGVWLIYVFCLFCFFFQAEDGIRDLVRSRGLGDVYKRQALGLGASFTTLISLGLVRSLQPVTKQPREAREPLSLIHI